MRYREVIIFGITRIVASVALTLAALGGAAGADPLQVTARPIERFSLGSDQTTFGSLTFIGGLELSSPDRRFGGLSGIAIMDGGSKALAVGDRGYLVEMTFRHDGARLIGISGASILPLARRRGSRSGLTDAEDIALDPNNLKRAVIPVESDPAWPLIAIDLDDPSATPEVLGVPAPVKRLRRNQQLESAAFFQADSRYAATLLVIAERSDYRRDDKVDAWILGHGHFTIRRRDGFDITSARFLPGGDLMLLERYYSSGFEIRMRLRRIAGDRIFPGSEVDGDVLLDAGFSQQIDNMEGLDVHTDNRGQTILTLVSDDNLNILQRTLILQFLIAENDSGG